MVYKCIQYERNILNAYNLYYGPSCCCVYHGDARSLWLSRHRARERNGWSTHALPFQRFSDKGKPEKRVDAAISVPAPNVNVVPSSEHQIVYVPVMNPWVSIGIVLGLTLSTFAALTTVVILYLRPVLMAAQRVVQQTEKTAVDLEKAAEEMEKTALMFQEDVPLTLRDMQRASEEWELVGKQFNFLVGTVTKPLKPQKVEPVQQAAQAVGRAAQAVGAQAGNTTATISKRLATDTSSIANALWTTVNHFRRQLGLKKINSKKTAEEAKKIADLGRKQQEARAWIERWRGRTRNAHSSGDDLLVSGNNSGAKLNDKGSFSTDSNLNQTLDKKDVESYGHESQLYAVEAVFKALERAQRAAEEAALSSSALEEAIQKAESTGALSSSDEEDWLPMALQGEDSDGLALESYEEDDYDYQSKKRTETGKGTTMEDVNGSEKGKNPDKETDAVTRQRILDEDVGVW